MKVFVVLALVCSPLFAWAQSEPAPLSERIWWRSSHNKLSAEVNRVLGNTPSSATPASSTGAAAKGFTISNQANQWPSLRTKTPAPLPAGYSRPVIDVDARVVPSSAAGAIGRFLRKGVPLLSTGFALYDLGQELGFGLDNSSGQLVVQQTSTVYGYLSGVSGRPPRANPLDACNDIGSFTGATILSYSAPYAQVRCSWNGGASANVYSMQRSVLSQGQTPSTVEAFEAAIAAQSGWPTSSAINRSLADAITAGEGVQTQTPTVTGPATTPGPVTTTTDGVNNTTTTSTTVHNHSYAGDTVTTTSTTTNITINNTTGSVISSTTSTTTPVLPEQDKTEEDTSFTNSNLPPIPKLYEPEFPDGLEGVWNDRKAQLLDTSLFQIIPALMPNVGDGGCPTWSIPSIYGGNLNASIPCNVWYFIRLVIIISALMLARRLIFGG